MTNIAYRIQSVCFSWLVILVLTLPSVSRAEVYGIEALDVRPSGEPPDYDLEKISASAQDSDSRQAKASLLRLAFIIAMHEVSSRDADTSGCNNPLLASACLVSEIANSFEDAARTSATLAAAQLTLEQWYEESQKAGTAAQSEDLATSLNSLLSGPYIQLAFADAVKAFIKSKDYASLADSSAADAPRPDYVLDTHISRVTTEGNYLDARISVRVYGQMSLRKADEEKILKSYALSVETPELYLDDWALGGTKQVSMAMAASMHKIAEVLTEEVLMIVTSPDDTGKGYVLEAIQPENKLCLRCKQGRTIKNYGFRFTDSLQPTFRWQPFEEVYEKAPRYAGQNIASDDIRYELRIFEAKRVPISRDSLGSGRLIHQIDDIREATYTPESFSLAPCTAYTWTVRAKFTLQDRAHLTRWSGNYKEKQLDEWRSILGDPTGAAKFGQIGASIVGQDNQYSYKEQIYYFPFITPREDGKEKCKVQFQR